MLRQRDLDLGVAEFHGFTTLGDDKPYAAQAAAAADVNGQRRGGAVARLGGKWTSVNAARHGRGPTARADRTRASAPAQQESELDQD